MDPNIEEPQPPSGTELSSSPSFSAPPQSWGPGPGPRAQSAVVRSSASMLGSTTAATVDWQEYKQRQQHGEEGAFKAPRPKTAGVRGNRSQWGPSHGAGRPQSAGPRASWVSARP